MRFACIPLACLVLFVASLTPLRAQQGPGTPAPHLAHTDESVQIAQGHVMLTRPAQWQSVSMGQMAPGVWSSLLLAPRVADGAVAHCTVFVDTRPWVKDSKIMPPDMRQKAQWSTEDWKRYYQGPYESVNILQTKAWSVSGVRVQQVLMTASARKSNDNMPPNVKMEGRSYLSADGVVHVACAARSFDPVAVASVYRDSQEAFSKVFDSVRVQMRLPAGASAVRKEREDHTPLYVPGRSAFRVDSNRLAG